MSKYESLSEDQKDVYFEIVRSTDEFQQFEQWLNLSSIDAKQILAVLPTETRDSLRFQLTMFYKNGDYAQAINTAYTGEPSKVQYTIQRVKKFWEEKVIVLTKEDELEYSILESNM